jgi:hypothetical protein
MRWKGKEKGKGRGRGRSLRGGKCSGYEMEDRLRYLREGRNLKIRKKKWSMTFSAKQIKSQCQHGKINVSKRRKRTIEREENNSQ